MLAIDLKDKLLLLMSAVLAAYASYMLVQPEPRTFSGRTISLPIAEVKTYSNIVKKKPVESVSWESVNSQNKLFQGDQVFTHDDSFAEIVYKDSTSLNLLPNTLLKIEESADGVNVDLKKGFLSLNFTKDAKKKINLRIGKKKLAISSKNATFQISSIKNKSQITLVKGKAKIDAGKASKFLKNGDSIKIDSNKKEIEITSVDIFPTSPRMGASIDFMKGPINFSWKAKIKGNGEVDYKILLSKSPSLKSAKIINSKSTKQALDYLPSGTYYWKVSSDKGEGPIYNFKVKRPGTPSHIGPSTNKIVKIAMKEKSVEVNLKWKGSYPKGFLVSIASGDKAPRIITTKKPELTLKDIKSSTYTWKVKANDESAVWGPSRQFTVKRENYLKPLLPLLDKEIKILSLKEKVKFEWFGIKSESYLFKIYKDKELQEEVFQREIKGTKASLNMKTFGDYFCTVSSKKYPDISIPPTPFTVKASIASLISPKLASTFMMLKDSYKVKFQWKNLGLKEYPSELQVSMDKTFEEIISKTKIKGTRATLPMDIQGEYFWRIVPLDDENKDLSGSEIRSFKITLPPMPKAPKIARKQMLELLKGYNIEQYVISWPKVKYGREYVIEIYDKNNLKKRLTRAKVKSTKILWRGERSGAFYYRVKVIDNWGRESGWSKTGTLISPISPFD